MSGVGCSKGDSRVLTHNQHSLYSATHCIVTTAAVCGARLLAWGIIYNQSSSSSVATVVSSPADQSLCSTRHLWMSLLCGCKRQPRHTRHAASFYGQPFFSFIVLSPLCHCVYSRWQGFSCPSPLLWFVWIFIHVVLCSLGICILHALLAGLLINLWQYRMIYIECSLSFDCSVPQVFYELLFLATRLLVTSSAALRRKWKMKMSGCVECSCCEYVWKRQHKSCNVRLAVIAWKSIIFKTKHTRHHFSYSTWTGHVWPCFNGFLSFKMGCVDM